ncbi:MAG: class I SAM-dependent methyltransferase [Candidatus Pacebacteria bacterium]|nr:class I SAM-dependent methyltransferase [Candidatus Paceibacterota bacterium]
MSNHLQNLLSHTPDLLSRKVLDIGSGKGDFLVEVAIEGGEAQGIEKHREYIKETLKNAKRNNVSVKVTEGVAEKLPFQDKEFGFINISEVIEHVKDPNLLIKEAYRVLGDDGTVYISIPSRFSLKDPHFHLYFVNWLPRFVSDSFISIFGKHKDYSGDAGKQRLGEMHYYRFYDIKRDLVEEGFEVVDIREDKIRKKFRGLLGVVILILYRLFLRPFYLDTFHILLRK